MSTGTEPSAAEPEAPAGLNLGTRFFLATAALLGVTLALALAVGSRQAQRVVEARTAAELAAVPAIFDSYREVQGAARRHQVASLAAEPGTKALLAEAREHQATLRDTAADFARNLGARAVLLLDDHGQLLARSDRADGVGTRRDFSAVSWVAGPLAGRQEASAFILELSQDHALSLVAAAPVVQGGKGEARLNGVIAATFPLGRERAAELARLVAGEAAFVASVAPRGAPIALETLAATGGLASPELAARLAALPEITGSVLGEGRAAGPFVLDVGGEAWVVQALPLLTGSSEPIGLVLAARSQDAALAPFREIRQSLLAIGALALLLAVPVSYLVAQGLVRPIRQLAESARRIGHGDLAVSLPAAGGGEVGALARAFAGMVLELREKGQLESFVAGLLRRPADVTHRGVAPGAETADGPAVGSLFASRYEVLSVLGQGGMGTVYRARDRELDDEIALKVLALEPGSGQIERIRQEFRLARAITHPNVVRVHDLGEAAGVPFLTMEFVPGTTLRELIDRHGGVELTPALQIAKQACRGLAAVHKAGIVHGDLKPQNVMVTPGGVAKLMDFGVARRRLRQEPGGPLVEGTPLYMSPEQVKGADLDDRSDIYSAGVVLFELFTGRRPFEGQTAGEIMEMHLSDPPPDPRQLRPGLPEPLARLILACLAKHRPQRPASAAELDRLLMRVRL